MGKTGKRACFGNIYAFAFNVHSAQRSPSDGQGILTPSDRASSCMKNHVDGRSVLKMLLQTATQGTLTSQQAKVGELTMKLELAEMLLERRGYGDELVRLKKSRDPAAEIHKLG